ncbi:hypothetical protein E3N88_00356 [Mikania micrantha]|uniref:Uncharacterized protein n=1 Tax=Mikania micrantha TaxID=192012 RepID=A0A5N6Q0J6_9ASTR|nr:hypothetical protein E3N88_00356 [Mikania micrantha]
MIHNDYKRCASQKSLGPLTGHPSMHSLALAYSCTSPEKACKKTKSTQWLVSLWQALRDRRFVPSSPDYGEHPMASTERPKQYVLP